MNENKNKQTPYTTNQIENKKPNVERSDNILKGYIANSMNGGHNRTIAYKKVMAGERHKEYRMKIKIHTLTPLTPAYQNLICTIRTYFVPNSRIWTNAEKYTAQKGGTTEVKIEKIPNLEAKNLPIMLATGLTGVDEQLNNNYGAMIMHTTAWRDAFISSYMPRMKYNALLVNQELETTFTMPQVSILALRGRVAIFNDFERNKEYDEEVQEYKGDNVTDQEWQSYLPIYANNIDYYNMRAKRMNSYYTDYRTELQGFAENAPNIVTDNGTRSFIKWSDWESKIAEARSQAENAQKNDWDIIAEIRGSKKLTEGKVQLIGEKTFNLNYSAITQNTYNTNENVREEFQVMGQQGAYSFTEVDIPCYAGFEAVEEGYIHIIATVQAETVFESAYDRNELNVTPLNEYRPDLINEKYDVLYNIENGSALNTPYYDVIGYKRKFSEYFKLPNVIAGDMTSLYYKQSIPVAIQGTNGYTMVNKILLNYNGSDIRATDVITNKTYQFFETDRYGEAYSNGLSNPIQDKKIWKDYTDLMINKNQAIENEVYRDINYNTREFIIKGQNQIFFMGKCYLVADMPIDEQIKHNFTNWGEI